MATRVKVGTLFLNNSTGAGVAGGAATGESTTPWATRDANWTPHAPVPLPAWGGGPPFAIGRVLAYQGYDDVTEQIPLLLDATSHDDAAAELQLLRTEALRTIVEVPTVLEIKPDGSTNSMYAEIKTAWLQEEGILESPVGGALRMRATLTIVRSPFFGRLSTGETLINAQTFENDGTGTPDNIVPYSTGVGDLIYEGGPLNCAISLPAATSAPPAFIDRVWAASVFSRTYSTTFAGSQTTSNTTDGVTIGSALSFSVSDVLTKNLGVRFMCRLTSASANAQFQVRVELSPITVYTGPWVDNVGTLTQMLDLGGYSLRELIRRSKGLTSPTISIQFYIRSVSGSVSATVTYGEVLLYYTFCELTLNNDASTKTLLLDTFAEQTNAPCLPFQTERAIVVASNSITDIVRKKGRLPRYVSGASLWLSWMDTATADHTRTEQATVTVTHAALWKTFRGAS